MTVSTKRRASSSSSADDFSPSPSPEASASRPTKKANRSGGTSAPSSSQKIVQVLDASDQAQHGPSHATLPARIHGPTYHRPLLLDQPSAISSFLEWYRSISSKRDMPWRAPYIDPSSHTATDDLRSALKVRAYQVWISEIMLQQTRVETVKQYWLNWMAKYPTIESLAAADEEDVLSSWRGLGYYSRATRIHTAAKKVVADRDMDGLLPETPQELEKNVPGVGPYTAGAISSIVFGKPVPILDGNVARVLARQLGLYSNPKAKATTDLMWAVAARLVVKAYEVEGEKGEVPGEWNQALMELGSTVCTPTKPGCGECRIRPSCRAYHEAEADAVRGKKKQKPAELVDIEDLCTYCEPIPFVEEESPNTALQDKPNQKAINKLRQATLSFDMPSSKPKPLPTSSPASTLPMQQAIEKHITKFPMKLEKKKIRTETCLVCIILRPSGEFLLEQRPSTGLLASMWQFPSLTLSTTSASASTSDDTLTLHPDESIPDLIDTFVSSLLPNTVPKTKAKLASITHLFSHLHLTMHVYKVVLPANAALVKSQKQPSAAAVGEKKKDFGSSLGCSASRRWATAEQVEAETMGTGMRNCWLTLQSQQRTKRKS
ncbi:A/G-specific adenine DNA glycosylase [Pseudozyma hubeiensis SY62]|uniref:Adenine DNA glycosylase n=1 Tax=Pseudozyma hubeiensis (strain SY62) TaxID=1305764 RepID=R9PE30_PSEHS|nr:A/G-specific adenine DNA glycosylase [Pseudozyma hubeiensis SY62]GAC99629.1 A/G-specific adenine DNA glycosylase [Pseudozyma hubeiensis SY62]